MSIFDVTYSGLTRSADNPVLRQEKELAWLAASITPVQYLFELIFDDYINGSSYALWASNSAYTAGDRVIDNRRVFENISGSTSGVTTSTDSKWREINRNYIGANERSRYSAQKMTFEYGLNQWFQVPGPSLIYIENTPVSENDFLIGETGAYSSTISNSSHPSATTVSYVGATFTGLTSSCYTIFVPSSTWTTLANSNTERESVVRSFANQLNIAGMIFSVSSY